MNEDRSEMIKKAKAKHSRRQKTESASKTSRRRKSTPNNAAVGLAEKVLEVAHDAAAQVGALVKTAAATVTGGPDDKAGQGARKRPKRH